MGRMLHSKDVLGAGAHAEHQSGSGSAPVLESAPNVVSSDVLFSGQRELIIQHKGQTYRLRRTQQEKLILTK